MTTLAPVLSSPGWEILTAASTRPEFSSLPLPQLGAVLRERGIPADTVSAILTQLTLREAATAKFGDFASHMVFTRDGLEQATRMNVAARHAGRLRAAGISHVADLGCGIGSDALVSASLGLKVLAVDIDPDAAAAAAANLRDFPSAQVQLGDILDLDMKELAASGIDAIYADPARRTGSAKGSARISHPDQWSPPLSTVIAWEKDIPAIGVKVAPGIAYEHIPPTWHAQWVSVNGDLVEASLWSPPLAPEGPGRSAMLLSDDGRICHTLSAPAHDPSTPASYVPTRALGTYIAQPDPAVTRAGLLGRLASDTGSGLISEGISYLTGDDIAPSPFLTRFEVLDVTNLRPKAISAALRSLGATGVEIKKRGADISPEALRRSLKLPRTRDHSPLQLTVFATRIQGKHKAIIARRDNVTQ